MKMKILPIIILTLFLVSCTLPGSNIAPSIGRGIKLEFVEYPKAELEENEPFTVTMRLTNNAPHDLEGEICLYDTPAERFGGIPSGECRSIFTPAAVEIDDYFEPQQEIFYFPAETGYYSYQSLGQNTKQTTSISATLKYITQTTSSATVCIKNPMLRDESRLPSSCSSEAKISSIKQPRTPIEVTKIEKKASSLGPNMVKLRFNIHLKQVEDGIILSRDNLYQGVSEQGKVEFEAGFYGGETFQCTPVNQGRIDFREKQKVIKCMTTVNIEQEYVQEPLVVNLGYGFKKTANIPEIELNAEEIYV